MAQGAASQALQGKTETKIVSSVQTSSETPPECSLRLGGEGISGPGRQLPGWEEGDTEVQAWAQLPAGWLQTSPFSCLSISFVLCKVKCFLGGLVNCEASPSQKDLFREPSGPTEGSGVVNLQRGRWSFPTWEALP